MNNKYDKIVKNAKRTISSFTNNGRVITNEKNTKAKDNKLPTGIW